MPEEKPKVVLFYEGKGNKPIFMAYVIDDLPTRNLLDDMLGGLAPRIGLNFANRTRVNGDGYYGSMIELGNSAIFAGSGDKLKFGTLDIVMARMSEVNPERPFLPHRENPKKCVEELVALSKEYPTKKATPMYGVQTSEKAKEPGYPQRKRPFDRDYVKRGINEMFLPLVVEETIPGASGKSMDEAMHAALLAGGREPQIEIPESSEDWRSSDPSAETEQAEITDEDIDKLFGED